VSKGTAYGATEMRLNKASRSVYPQPRPPTQSESSSPAESPALDPSPHLPIRRRSCPHNRPARKFEAERIATTVFHDGPYKTLADIEYATAGWVDWYNHRRLRGSLGMLTPTEYEQHHYAAISPEPQPT
jgi:transposase InsO family protein